MNIKFYTIAFVFILAGCSQGASPRPANEAPPTQPPKQVAMPSHQEMMKLWEEFSTPGSEHKVLEPMVGKWKYTLEFWQDPAQPPQKSNGVADIKWSMGGRFLEQNSKGKAMGMPFEGKGIIGYDKVKKAYQSIWYDNMSTALMLGSGQFDADKKALSDSGSMSCPITNGSVPYRSVTTITDKNHFRYEWFVKYPGTESEMKAMNIEYIRAK